MIELWLLYIWAICWLLVASVGFLSVLSRINLGNLSPIPLSLIFPMAAVCTGLSRGGPAKSWLSVGTASARSRDLWRRCWYSSAGWLGVTFNQHARGVSARSMGDQSLSRLKDPAGRSDWWRVSAGFNRFNRRPFAVIQSCVCQQTVTDQYSHLSSGDCCPQAAITLYPSVMAFQHLQNKILTDVLTPKGVAANSIWAIKTSPYGTNR